MKLFSETFIPHFLFFLGGVFYTNLQIENERIGLYFSTICCLDFVYMEKWKCPSYIQFFHRNAGSQKEKRTF